MTRTLAQLAHRYLPIAVSVTVLLTLVVFVPDRHQTDQPAAGFLPSIGSAPSGQAQGESASPGAAGGGAGAGAGAGAGGQSVGPGGATAANGAGSVPGGAGQTAVGPSCTGGSRQFSFIPYAPLCHEFSGSNGGATAHGVTASTITMTMRQTADNDAGKAEGGLSSFAAESHDAGVFINYLNSQYQLYGRKVVLKTFSGQGSFGAEVGGQDQAGAATDAQTAYDDGAFAEGPNLTPPSYTNALASKHIINFGFPDATLADLNANYPYQFGYAMPPVDFVGSGGADVICQRMAGMKAIHAGDATLASMQRSFALIEPLQDGTSGGSNVLISRASQKCGVTVTRYQYDANPGQYAPEAGQIASELKAANTTTVVMSANVIFGPIMTSAASADQYHPEWLNIGNMTNGATRQMSADEVSHMIFMPPWHAQNFAPSGDACYSMYVSASGGAGPQSNLSSLDLICSSVLEFFGALETAGPNLTPASFGQGFFSQPPSTSAGEFGKWSFGAGGYCGCSSFTMQRWNPSPTNPYDGAAGTPEVCREPGDLPYLNPTLGSGPLNCFS